jgi:hypothetical protein
MSGREMRGRDILSTPSPQIVVTLASSLTISSSDATGNYITTSTAHGMSAGDGVEVSLSGGTAGGITDGGLYFVVPVTGQSARFQVTLNRDDALAIAGGSTAVSVVDITANIGAGTAYPVYTCSRACVWVGGAGNLSVLNDTRTKVVTISGVPAGALLPISVHGIGSRYTTASSLVLCS